MNKRTGMLLLLMGLLVGCGKSQTSSSISEESSLNDNSSVIETSSLVESSEEISSTINSTNESIISSSEVSVDTSSEESSSKLLQGQYDAPTSGYALLITPTSGSNNYYVPLVSIPEKDGEGRDQFFGDDIILEKGDIFQIYDGTNSVSWSSITIEEYGQGLNFLGTSNGIQTLESGTYDFYVKLMFENDRLYIGNQNGE